MEEKPRNNLPFVTVIIPTFNCASLLKELLESLSVQTYPHQDFEIIVAENGDPAEDLEIISALREHSDQTIRFHKTNFKGPSGSRNFALGLARGEIIAFIDSDCVALPHWLEKGVAAFTGPIGIVQGKTVPNPNHKRHLLEKTVNVTKEGPRYETCNVFYLKRALEKVGFFSPEYEEFGYPFFWRGCRSRVEG